MESLEAINMANRGRVEQRWQQRASCLECDPLQFHTHGVLVIVLYTDWMVESCATVTATG